MAKNKIFTLGKNLLHKNFLFVVFVFFVSFLTFTPTQNVNAASCGTDIGCHAVDLGLELVQGLAYLVSSAVNLIEAVTHPDVYNTVFRLNSLYLGWGVIRDLFNIAFIFALLFSAFATIFQVQRYHLKNFLLIIIVMALLINFSWPVTRFLIDVSNVIMFYFLGNIGSAGNMMAIIAQDSQFGELTLGAGEGGDRVYAQSSFLQVVLLMIYMFMFLITIFAIAAQLLIRVAALAILLIFSPIGFAGVAIPSMQGASSRWWSTLMKYLLVGPISIFLIVFSAFFIQELALSQEFINIVDQSSRDSSQWGTEYAASFVKMIIPMALLWSAVTAGQSMGTYGAGYIASKARGVATGVPRRLGGAFNKYGGRTAKYVGGVADRNIGRFTGGVNVNSVRQSRQDKLAARKVAQQARRDENYANYKKRFGTEVEKKTTESKLRSKQIADQKKANKDANLSIDNMHEMGLAAKEGSTEIEAFAQSLSENAGFKGATKLGDEKMLAFLKKLDNKDTQDSYKMFESKMKKEGRADLVAKHYAANGRLGADGERTDMTKEAVAKEVYGKMDAETLAKNDRVFKIAAQNSNSPEAKVIKLKLENDEFKSLLQGKLNDGETFQNMQKVASGNAAGIVGENGKPLS